MGGGTLVDDSGRQQEGSGSHPHTKSDHRNTPALNQTGFSRHKALTAEQRWKTKLKCEDEYWDFTQLWWSLSKFCAGANLCLLMWNKLVIIAKWQSSSFRWKHSLQISQEKGIDLKRKRYCVNSRWSLMGVPLQWDSSGEVGMEGRGRGPGAPGLRGLLEQVNLREILKSGSNLPTKKLEVNIM